jgi:hypothetical protein
MIDRMNAGRGDDSRSKGKRRVRTDHGGGSSSPDSLEMMPGAFACEKIGLTRPIKMNPSGRPTTDIAQMKRRLLKAIQELESIGYIKILPPLERFTKDNGGTWEVHFERQLPLEEQVQTTLEIQAEELSPLEGRLVGHGVTRSQARKLISEYDDARIEVQLEVLEFLLIRGGESAPTNRGGSLVKAIVENYSLPRGFKSSAQLAAKARNPFYWQRMIFSRDQPRTLEVLGELRALVDQSTQQQRAGNLDIASRMPKWSFKEPPRDPATEEALRRIEEARQTRGEDVGFVRPPTERAARVDRPALTPESLGPFIRILKRGTGGSASTFGKPARALPDH